MPQVISVVSGKGGVGKTTTVANVGAALAAMGKRVLLIDADVGLRNLDISLGMQDKVVYHFNDIINGQCTPTQAIVPHDKYLGLQLLTAPQNVLSSQIDKDKFKELVLGLKQNYDYVLIDCAAGIDDSFVMGAMAADMVIIVATPELISVRDADRVAVSLEKLAIEQINLIINIISVDMVKKGDMIDIDTIINTVAVPLIGAVPESSEVIVSNNKGRPIVLSANSYAGKAFLNIAKRITGEKVPILKEKKRNIFRLLKK
jgi:septum site-determining protein MinD